MFKKNLLKLKQKMKENNIDLAVITDDDSLYYFTGYYNFLHMDFFRPTILLVPKDDDSTLITPLLDVLLVEKDCPVENVVTWNDGIGEEWREVLPKFIKENTGTIGIISNGTRSPRWWRENKKYFDHVCFSFHSEFSKPNKFLNVIKEVNGEFRTHVNIMMNPESWEECVELAERIPEECHNVSLALQPLMEGLGERKVLLLSQSDQFSTAQHELG